MRSIRARLTFAYAGAMVGTMIAFTAALWTARRASSYEELSKHVLAQANLASTIISQASKSGPVTVTRDTLNGPMISPELRTLLEGMEGYVLVLDPSGRLLYGSFALRQLSEDDRTTLQREAIAVKPGGQGELLDVGGDRLLLVAVNEDMDVPNVQRVVAAESVKSTDIAIRELIGTSLAVAPLLLMASVGLAYMIAGRAFRPVGQMINEMRAITDGRSLHRRLPIDDANEEMARLGITLNEMMERLEKSFSALRRFTADASHELKTPLAVLRADVERSMSGASTRAERMVALEEALHETTRMADLVESLLTLARADEGRFDLHRERVDLEPLAREVFETATILAEPAGLTVTMAEPARVAVFGDRARLRQLFLNLTTNAIKYTPRGGSVEVSLISYEHTAAFSVRDTGIGISASDLPHIFERFYRADRARSRGTERSGFGLGLAISQWIAEAHGGTISVRSRYGRGSTFTVTLPVSGEEPDRVLRDGAEGPAAA
ncbi:MAG TPA: HAMP domain-containing sensor histidine kinase [Gemmatimonadaceae bacterium]|nr:HAMP domain-containing sensor histidine kinase [Gemmatimonadaceae bacterium]